MPISRYHADHPHDVEFNPACEQREQRADPGGRQRGEDGQRVDVALVQDAEHDIYREQGRHNQPRLVFERSLKHLGRALEAAAY